MGALGNRVRPPDDRGIFFIGIFNFWFNVRYVLEAEVVIGFLLAGYEVIRLFGPLLRPYFYES